MSEKTQSGLVALENNPKMKKLIFGGLIAFLSLVFLAGLGLGINNVLLTEGTMEIPPEIPKYASPMPENADDAISRLNLLLENAAAADSANRAKLSVGTSFSVDGDSIAEDGDDTAFDEILIFIKDDVLSSLQNSAYSFSSPFNGDFSGKLPSPSFGAQDIKDFACTPMEEDAKRCVLNLVFNEEPLPENESDVLYSNFRLDSAETQFKQFCDTCKSIFTVADSEIICRDFEIRAEYDATENRVSVIEYKRNYAITVRLSFTGELAALGEKTISFNLLANERYDFIYASLDFSVHELWLEKGDIDNFEAYVTADEDVALTWESSDSLVASVDDEGYIKGHRVSDKPVTITATFEYLGNTYEDSCTVYVRKPLKEIKLAESELTLKTGETHSVDVNFSPKSATVKQLTWISDDESIASVDKNGLITAVSPGTVNIYAVALDGNFKSVCMVTVKGGEANG